MKSNVAFHDPPAPEATVSSATDKEPTPQPPSVDPEFLAWLEELL
ncbi:MAG: hypothetical protein WCS43_01020 [Verrucomicrobiota bacterium]